jgi:hypothetical protein
LFPHLLSSERLGTIGVTPFACIRYVANVIVVVLTCIDVSKACRVSALVVIIRLDSECRTPGKQSWLDDASQQQGTLCDSKSGSTSSRFGPKRSHSQGTKACYAVVLVVLRLSRCVIFHGRLPIRTTGGKIDAFFPLVVNSNFDESFTVEVLFPTTNK